MKENVFTRRLNLPLETTPRRLRLMRFLRVHGPMLVGALVLIFTVGTLTIVLFLRSTSALDHQLRETLRATAVASALSIDGDDLASIDGPDDMDSPEYLRIAALLRSVVDDIPQARFAYVLRRTDDPNVLSFVVDADALASPATLDLNGNGSVDPDEEPSYPGELYDVSDMPALQDEAFRTSTTDPEVTVDQWGEFLSGYAPIRSGTTGDVVAVLGVDMDAAEFRALTRSILSPIALLLILALTFALAVGVALLIESRQLSALARINAERSGLLQLTFHQLGEPITILQWGIETLEDSKDDVGALQNALPENLADMREGVRRLGSIIDTLQEAEKVELKAFENVPVEQPVKAFLENAIPVVAPAVSGMADRVVVEAEDATFAFDPHLLTIVLRRLVENALEFSPAESSVRVRAHAEGKWLRIEVVDTGCGIPKQDLPHLFEKYRRASNATLMKPDGNGLGLYIVRGILEIMGGDIAVDTMEGKGTTVTVRVPAHPAKRS
jgi:signal transduction histidine kinase